MIQRIATFHASLPVWVRVPINAALAAGVMAGLGQLSNLPSLDDPILAAAVVVIRAMASAAMKAAKA